MTNANAYSRVAPEYYDRVRHPTCANFRTASRQLIEPWLTENVDEEATICEVGAGRSLVAEILEERGRPLRRLVITDASAAMLAHSEKWLPVTLRFTVAKADSLPIGASTMDLVVASLGDPYNSVEFWTECERVLRPNGVVLYTTPSFEWANAFRQKGDPHVAEFELRDGTFIDTPSNILPIQEQVDLISQSRLSVLRVCSVPLDALIGGAISPKLTEVHASAAGIVTGFLVRKSLDTFG